jgi:hypothetical protein
VSDETPTTLSQSIAHGLKECADITQDNRLVAIEASLIEQHVREFLSQKFATIQNEHGYASEAIQELWTMITREEVK